MFWFADILSRNFPDVDDSTAQNLQLSENVRKMGGIVASDMKAHVLFGG